MKNTSSGADFSDKPKLFSDKPDLTLMICSILCAAIGILTVNSASASLSAHGRYIFMQSAAAVIGITTISANSILFSSKNQIKGLTTSVGLWCCGVVGMALGAGLYVPALVLFLALLACMSAFPVLEKHLKNRSNHFEVHLELKSKGDLADFVATIRALGIRIDDIESNPAYLGSGLSVFSVSFTVTSPELKKYKKHEEIIEALRSLEYVYFVEEMN